MAITGSSPRVRGTRSTSNGYARHRRFIPARAGNACLIAASNSGQQVHPRACGERVEGRNVTLPLTGSSPRVRGTHCSVLAVDHHQRFIPARAGNASCP